MSEATFTDEPLPVDVPAEEGAASALPTSGGDTPCRECGGQVTYSGRGRRPTRCADCREPARAREPRMVEPARKGPGPKSSTDKASTTARGIVKTLRSLTKLAAKVSKNPGIETVWDEHWDAITAALTEDFRAHKSDMDKVEGVWQGSTRVALLVAVAVPAVSTYFLVNGARKAKVAAKSREQQQQRPAGPDPRAFRRAPSPRPPEAEVSRETATQYEPSLMAAFGGV